MTADRDKKIPLPLHIPKCIVRVLSSSHVPLPVVSGLSCIAARAGRACIGCQRRPPHPGRQKVTPALRRLVRLCPSFVPPVRARTNSPLVTRLIYIAPDGQWVAQFLHLDRPGPVVVPLQPLGCRPQPSRTLTSFLLSVVGEVPGGTQRRAAASYYIHDVHTFVFVDYKVRVNLIALFFSFFRKNECVILRSMKSITANFPWHHKT